MKRLYEIKCDRLYAFANSHEHANVRYGKFHSFDSQYAYNTNADNSIGESAIVADIWFVLLRPGDVRVAVSEITRLLIA